MNKRKGLTAIEILTVIGSAAFLAGVLMPVLSSDRNNAKRAQCSAQMKQYGFAILMYADDNNQKLPYFAKRFSAGSAPPPNEMWYGIIEPYLSGKHASPVGDSMLAAKIRRCPSGMRNPQAGPYFDYWKGWIGVNYGGFNIPPNQLSLAPIVYGEGSGIKCEPILLSNIKKTADWIMLLDVEYFFVYTPAAWIFDEDYDNDGLPDSASINLPQPYNGAMPKIHSNGCNVGLVDGHVEWVAFNDLWKTDANGKVTHTFWYND